MFVLHFYTEIKVNWNGNARLNYVPTNHKYLHVHVELMDIMELTV